MQELVEIVRRDHAVLHDRVREGTNDVDRAIDTHLAFLDGSVAPAVEALGPLAASEWAVAREALLDARELAGRPTASADLAETITGHANRWNRSCCRGWSASSPNRTSAS